MEMPVQPRVSATIDRSGAIPVVVIDPATGKATAPSSTSTPAPTTVAHPDAEQWSVPAAPAASAGIAIPLPDPALAARLSHRMQTVEQALQDAVRNTDRLADDVTKHLLSAGGKRLRPFLALLCGELGNPDAPELINAAIVVELTHLATLYHDDVMDSAPVRRGVPAVHTVWGNQVAILMGDLLFARASQQVGALGPEAVMIQAQTFERLCIGQLHETVGPAPHEDPVAHYLQVLADKTASLLATSARFGAMYSHAPAELIEVVAAYGEQVGVAFQLADDVIDLAETGASTGKTPGTDLREGVPTMPVLLLRQRLARGVATSADQQLLADLDGDLTSDELLDSVVTRLREHDVLGETRTLAAEYAHRAIAAIDPLPAGVVKDALVTFAQALVDRTA